MIKINENFLNLQDSYLFSTIAKKVSEFQNNNPDKKIIKLGIGDVTLPLAPACVEAMKKASSIIDSVVREAESTKNNHSEKEHKRLPVREVEIYF